MSKFSEDFKQFAEAHHYRIFRVAERQNGIQEELTLFPTCHCLNSYSIGKVFVVTAIGMLYDAGKLTPDMTLKTALGDEYPSRADPAYDTLTLHDLLKHRGGFPDGLLDIDTGMAATFGEDYLTYTLSITPVTPVGSREQYTDAAFYLLTRAVDRIADEPIESYLWKKLFSPLAFREVAWSHCPHNHAIGATGLYLHAGDMVKLGEIYLSGGLFEGKRILSEEAVSMIVTEEYELHPMANGKAFGKGGMNGQMLMMIPQQNRAVAWHAFETGDFSPLVDFVASYRD